MLFIGIDLAWSENNKSGIAILEGDKKQAKLISVSLALKDSEIIEFIEKYAKNNNTLISIDAPLIVPNEEGRRLAEALVGNLFRKFNAGAHPSNRKRLSSFTGSIRGEEISKLLEKLNFEHSPYIEKQEQSRKFFEVYPHPSMVVLFNLSTVIPYKSKPKRTYTSRYKAFRQYQNYLKNLNIKNSSEVILQDITELKAQKLKDYEDKLDAIFCAYLSYYTWLNPEKCKVLGNMKEGYILTPIFDSMKLSQSSLFNSKI
ncbi:DUF429 domain-containing protein [Candidatus Woesearchaeota archaeon]|nr:DUF429 domain-containing protein [Candidatus Woesearchaeota archaeon]